MNLHGQQLIGRTQSASSKSTFKAKDPRDQSDLEGQFHEGTAGEVDQAFEKADRAHPAFEKRGREARAALLEMIAADMEGLGDTLLERASAETGLPIPRLQGERGRTCLQLRLFASVVREGSYLGASIDHAIPDRTPIPRLDIRAIQRAIGPVAVFGASNFPLAYSVAGGDTASALAAGCPVVCKAHPNHPGTSEMVGRIIVDALKKCDLPEGVFSLVQGFGYEVGMALVQHPSAKAVGFTGSLRGGRALFDAAAKRPSPIPVFAEMGSTNPVFILPEKLNKHRQDLAKGLVGSITLGVGQFCTNPGIVVLQKGSDADAFIEESSQSLESQEEGVMLHKGIRQGFDRRLEEVTSSTSVRVLTREMPTGPCGARPVLMSVDASEFLNCPTLHEEVFGPCTLLVLCDHQDQMLDVAKSLAGQLTVTLHAEESELGKASPLLDCLEQMAGRVLFGGFPTGVEVCKSMVHGGPYPATTDSRFTAVGHSSIARFTRPVCYQSFPTQGLPEELRDNYPGLWRTIDGVLTQG